MGGGGGGVGQKVYSAPDENFSASPKNGFYPVEKNSMDAPLLNLWTQKPLGQNSIFFCLIIQSVCTMYILIKLCSNL